MLPIWKDKLSIEKITDRWSQEIQPPTSREELLDFFETAWWRGRWKTDGPLTPLALLKSMYRSARERDLTTLVFVTKEDEISEGIELADGGLLFDVNELERPAILVLVPSNDPETWTEASCAAAFELLSQTPSRKYYPDRSIQFLMMEIDRHQFVRLLAAHGLDLPKFWSPPIEKPSELHEKAQISTHRKQVPPARLEVRKRGRKPVKLEAVKREMRRDIEESRQTVASLRAMREKELQAYGGVSRDTGRKARAAILSEIAGETMKRDIREGRRTADSLRTMREKELGETYAVSSDIASKARTAVLSEIVEESKSRQIATNDK
jgi:hypothetical protein